MVPVKAFLSYSLVHAVEEALCWAGCSQVANESRLCCGMGLSDNCLHACTRMLAHPRAQGLRAQQPSAIVASRTTFSSSLRGARLSYSCGCGLSDV